MYFPNDSLNFSHTAPNQVTEVMKIPSYQAVSGSPAASLNSGSNFARRTMDILSNIKLLKGSCPDL